MRTRPGLCCHKSRSIIIALFLLLWRKPSTIHKTCQERTGSRLLLYQVRQCVVLVLVLGLVLRVLGLFGISRLACLLRPGVEVSYLHSDSLHLNCVGYSENLLESVPFM